MTAPRFAVLLLVLAAALCARPAASSSSRTTTTGMQQEKSAPHQKTQPPPALQFAPGFFIPGIAWPAPTMGANVTFAKREGAHFDNTFETWQVSGFLDDGSGNPMDFTVLFYKSGPVMMLLRHGFASLNSPGGFEYVSFAPANIRGAAENELKTRLQAEPDNEQIKERLARLQAGQSPEFVPIGDEARVLRNSLAVNFGAYTLNRADNQQLSWKLTADIRGKKLALDMSSPRDPLQFYTPYIKIGSRGSLDGYAFPVVPVSGSITGPDGAAVSVRGHAVMTHLWGAADPAGFYRYSMISMNFDTGLFLQTFRFYSPNGVMINEYTMIQEPLQAPRLITEFSMQETAHWTSALSGVQYPEQWAVSGQGFKGELALDGRDHEMSVAEGRGAFYLGPCTYRGEIPGKKGAALGRGFCRLVAPQP